MELTPRAVFDLARSTVETAVSVPGRVLGLLEAAESVVRRADDLVTRTEGVLAETEALVARASAVTATAEVVTADVGELSRTSRELVDVYAPLAQRAQPLAARFVEELTPQEVEAAVRLVDQLPELARHMAEDVLPILATLDRVGPDIHQLLDVVNDMRQAILGIPGFAFMRRRGEEKEDRGET
ncbi:hypothetical protein [Saccharothrix coeruleofusca]|nr:hypothetical protein [Saccharothrix coeruleofusca]MBP2337928.1 hypothetical protein [Saccharothrix coeruleofusca]